MAIRFILGRAGSGKTWHCLREIRARLANDAVDGHRLLLLVPEQSAQQMERAILEPWPAGTLPDVAAGHRVDVLSFRRLAFRILDGLGGSGPTALTEPARAMVLRHLLGRHADQLTYYRRVSRVGQRGGRLGGYIERLAATITELIQEAVLPDELGLAAASGGSKHSTGVDPSSEAKLHDLQLLYQVYIDYLGGERVDPSQYLALARARMDDCAWLAGAELWVDGFASFSGQELQTLMALAGRCRDVHISLLMDPGLHERGSVPDGEGQAVGGSTHGWHDEHLFRRTLRTYRQMYRAFAAAGLMPAAPLCLDGRRPRRFEGSPGLQRLERGLFGGDGEKDGGAKVEAAVVVRDAGSGPALELVALPGRRQEVEYAVSRLCQWVQDEGTGYRYRDVALIVRDLEPYHDLLSAALRARDVPFFIDRRRPVAHHPLVELLRGWVALAVEGLSLEAVRMVLKTGLLPVSVGESDALENYLIAHGLAGRALWSGDDWTFEARSSFAGKKEDESGADAGHLRFINEVRRRLEGVWSPWLEMCEAAHAGEAWAAALTAVLEALGVGKRLSAWAEALENDGEVDRAEEHRQVWRDVLSFLDDLGHAFGGVTLGIGELADVLETGLGGLTLGLVPPTVDQVLVGAIERSRHPRIRAAIVLGFQDGAFPRQIQEDTILHDEDRTRLRAAGVNVGPPARERLMDESMLAYIAVTRASERVVVTWATADEEGRALRPSPYVAAMERAGGVAVWAISDPRRSRATWDVLGWGDLSRRLGTEFRMRPPVEHDAVEVRGRWNELYGCTRERLQAAPTLRRALVTLGDDPQETRLAGASIERLFGGTLQASVSSLESYAACPFQYFARYMLRLKERPEAVLEAVDVGQVHHAILEDFVGSLTGAGKRLEGMGDEEMLGQLRESCARVAARLPEAGPLSDARSAYVLRRSASELARVIQGQRRLAAVGRASPKVMEQAFGFEGDARSLPALTLRTPHGRKVVLRGYIDRVDVAELGDELLGVVIDYKRSRDKRLDFSSMFHGLSLQLPGYLLVLAEHGRTLAGRPLRPIGALYVPLRWGYKAVDHPGVRKAANVGLKGLQPRGVIDEGGLSVLDGGDVEGWSGHYQFYRKKDGSLGYEETSDAVKGESLRSMMAHARLRLGELADGVLEGDVSVRPYRLRTLSPCSWCSMQAVCRFEMGVSEVRFLETLKRSDVFARMTSGQEGGESGGQNAD